MCSRSEVAQHKVDDLALERRERRIEQRDAADLQRLLEHAARIRERLETEEAVRPAHAAFSDPAKRKVQLVEVQQRVIDDRSTRAGVADVALDDVPVAAEDVHDERLLALADDAERFGAVAER